MTVCTYVCLCTCVWGWDTHACIVVVAVWKLNMFSLGNQLVSSAIRKKNGDSKAKWKTRKIFAPYGKRHKKIYLKYEGMKPATAPTLHSPPLHKWREGDAQEETAEERDGETKSHKYRPRHIQHLSPPDLRRNRSEKVCWDNKCNTSPLFLAVLLLFKKSKLNMWLIWLECLLTLK